jgi:hypothetical protein
MFIGTNTPDPLKMYVAIFAMMFAAVTAGNAQAFGPDLGKAKNAAEKIFGIIDQKSKIDVFEEDRKPKTN